MEVRKMFPSFSVALRRNFQPCELARASILGAVAASALAGCTLPQASNSRPGDRYVINAEWTQFFKYGPAQAFGPGLRALEGADGSRCSQHQFGYSHVLTDDGTAGYVATDDIAPAPPAQPPPIAAPCFAMNHPARSGGANTAARRPADEQSKCRPSCRRSPLFDTRRCSYSPQNDCQMTLRAIFFPRANSFTQTTMPTRDHQPRLRRAAITSTPTRSSPRNISRSCRPSPRNTRSSAATR